MAWWRHQFETFSALLAICAGNSPVTGEFPAQSPVTGALIFSLICVWINGWVDNRQAGDLRHYRYRAHHDVTVMSIMNQNRFWHDRNPWHILGNKTLPETMLPSSVAPCMASTESIEEESACYFWSSYTKQRTNEECCARSRYQGRGT